MKKNICILYDNISGNTGDVAIGLSLRKIMKDLGVDFDELIPGNFNPELYDSIIIGGGHLLRKDHDFYYDKFKVRGHNILNSMGIVDFPIDNEVSSLNENLKSKQNIIDNLQNITANLQNQTDDLHNQTHNLQNEIIGSQDKVIHLKSELENIYKSKGWKLLLILYKRKNSILNFMRKFNHKNSK